MACNVIDLKIMEMVIFPWLFSHNSYMLHAFGSHNLLVFQNSGYSSKFANYRVSEFKKVVLGTPNSVSNFFSQMMWQTGS